LVTAVHPAGRRLVRHVPHTLPGSGQATRTDNATELCPTPGDWS